MIKDSMDFDYAINKIITDTETTILPQGEYLNMYMKHLKI